MSTGAGLLVGEVNPSDAWEILSNDTSSVLVDVRTHAEWGFVGVPDLSDLGRSPILVEWAQYPGMSQNPRFVEALIEQLGGEVPGKMLFLCRSGARSLRAAEAVAGYFASQAQAVECLNVAEGFEGDLDEQNHRGATNGWKSRGLAWRQS